MCDYISRDELLHRLDYSDKWFCDSCGGSDDCSGFSGEFGMSPADLKEIIKSTPAADVRENTRGKWVTSYIDKRSPDLESVCSVCRSPATYICYGVQIKSNYCPWCGAEMVEVDDEG